MAPPARYRIEHDTHYVYPAGVSTSQHVAHLRPRELARQRVVASRLEADPSPAHAARRFDYFGNASEHFTVLKPHAELRVSARSLVEVYAAQAEIAPESSPPWEHVRAALVYQKGAPCGEASQFAYASPFVEPDDELAEFARPCFTPGRPLVAAAVDLMRLIHSEFRFDASATTVTTPVRRVLEERRGVCQDLAHVQIAGLRALGLAARYVSGYILTDPPPGQPRLAGADASHAWVSVHCPANGWVDLDPTNDLIPDQRHVTLGWGRDFGDVSPLRGVILGGAQHTLHVGVSVVPLDDAEWQRAVAQAAGA